MNKTIGGETKGMTMPNNALDVLLTEYRVLRDGLTKNFDHEIQIFTIVISILGIIYGIIFAYKVYDLLLFIPIIILPLALKFKYKWDGGVKKFSEYLSQIEEQIKKIIENQNKEWTGFQHFWHNKEWKNERNKIIKKYDLSSKCLIFVFIPVGVSFLYSLIIICTYIKSFFNCLPDLSHLFFRGNSQIKILQSTNLSFLVHLFLIVGYTYVLYRIIRHYYNHKPTGILNMIKTKI